MPAQANLLESNSRRFLFIDALRGFAAVIVVLFHVWHKNIAAICHLELPSPLEQCIRYGNHGVPIFFVLSGFVIAHSVYDRHISLGYFGRFIARRSLRLDPPYWASIALAVFLLAVSAFVLKRPSDPFPSWSDVAIHLVYLQEFLGVPEIVGVYWTLCYEVQFYLVFVAVLGLVQYLSKRSDRTKISRLGVLVFATMWGASLLISAGYLESPRGFFLDRWFQFFAGSAVYWGYRGYIPTWATMVVLAGTFGFDGQVDSIRIAVIATAGLIFLAARSGHLYSVSGGWAMQKLGQISYSLYLTHMLIGCRIARLGAERFPDLGLGPAVLLMTFSTFVSIVFAQAFYWVIERPSISWSKSVPMSPRRRQLAPAVPMDAITGQTNQVVGSHASH